MKQKKEFSKVIVFITGVIFLCTLIEIPILSCFSIDTSTFATQQIITSGGIFGASIIFYLNKSKLENSIKIKKSLIEWEWEFKQKYKLNEEQFEEFKQEIMSVNDAIDNKFDNVITETINEDVNILNF